MAVDKYILFHENKCDKNDDTWIILMDIIFLRIILKFQYIDHWPDICIEILLSNHWANSTLICRWTECTDILPKTTSADLFDHVKGQIGIACCAGHISK
jgi:hypothetical protein